MTDSKFQTLTENTAVCSLLMFICTLVSAINGNLWEYDFANYHYYNPWAFLNGREGIDIIPNGIHNFLNPLIDIPFYLIVTYFNKLPFLGYALQGIWTGLYMFAAYLIAVLLFERRTLLNSAATGIFLLLTLTRESTYRQIGTPTNEHAVGVFILFGLYFLLSVLKAKKFCPPRIFLSGLLLGMAFGLKATSITWCLTAGLSLILCLRLFKSPFKTLIIFTLSGLIGFLSINGYFMYHYWELYQNPFFPALNGIFRSEYYDAVNYTERGFCPRGIEYLQIPYRWLKYPKINEWHSYEKILILTHMLCLLALPALLFTKIRKFFQKYPLFIYLLLLWIISFYLWAAMFSVLRYYIVGETLGALIVTFVITKIYQYTAARLLKIKTIRNWFSAELTYIFCTIAFCLVLILPKTETLIHNFHNRGTKMLDGIQDMRQIVLPQDSLVELYNNDSSYIIPVLAENARFSVIGHPQNFWHRDRFDLGNESHNFGKFQQLADNLRRQHLNNTVRIFNFKSYSTGDLIKNHNLVYRILSNDDYCYEFPTFLPNQRMMLCFSAALAPSVSFPPQAENISADRYGLKLADHKQSRKYHSFEQNILYCAFANLCP